MTNTQPGPDVRAMCAIGQSGQIGLDGGMPWSGDTRPVFKADVARFFELTQGHVLLAGPATIDSVPAFARHDRDLVTIRSKDAPEEVLARFPGRVVYIGGGPAVWQAYARFIRHWDINRLPYDGPADRWFDPAWLTAGAPA